MQPLVTTHSVMTCNDIPCYNKANYTSPLIDVSVKKDNLLVYVLQFFGKCWKFFVKCWLFFSGYHVLGICLSGFSAVIIRIIFNMSVMWLCNVIVKMAKKCNLSNKGILACHFCFCIFLFVFEGFQSNIIITFAFWYMSFIEQRYWSCCITRWCGLGLGHYNAVWIPPKAVCGEILMVWFNTTARCKNVETCHFYFKALLVIHLWDIILTSALPSIPSYSCKFWACPCFAGNFEKGRGNHKQKIMDSPFKPK